MNLNKNEIIELQEQLILIYRAVRQREMFTRFFCEGIDTSGQFREVDELIDKLGDSKKAKKLLQGGIVELEEMKQEKPVAENASEIIASYDLDELYAKYEMIDPDEIGKLDIVDLLKLL